MHSSSATTTLDSSGNGQASELYLPYGGGRWGSGTMPTQRLYTGQVSDAATSGLDYYNARYYDPALGQFVSADTARDVTAVHACLWHIGTRTGYTSLSEAPRALA